MKLSHSGTPCSMILHIKHNNLSKENKSMQASDMCKWETRAKTTSYYEQGQRVHLTMNMQVSNLLHA